MNKRVERFSPDRSFNVVITGGPYAGKTTLINSLEAMGHCVVSEQAIKVIKQLTSSMGLSDFIKWREQSPIELQKLILDEQINVEKDFNQTSIRFLDRGRFDCLAYLQQQNLECPEELYRQANQHTINYDLVINCETLSNFDERSDTGRTETLSDSEQLHHILSTIYREKGLTVIPLEELPLNERVSKMLEIVDYYAPSSPYESHRARA